MLDNDKAYVFGLIIGGGFFGEEENALRIRLPYKNWGSNIANPVRAGKIAQDILRVVNPIFVSKYNVQVSYDATQSGIWNLILTGDLTNLKNDLEEYEIVCEGEIKRHATIDKIVKDLIDENLKRRFIAGLADTIGSIKESHRRFTPNTQIISFEFPGFNFDFVCKLCKLLHSIKCYPNQVLWNHPNFHSSNNPYYKSWKKGFKLRVLLDQYEKFGAFAFSSKASSAIENLELQHSSNTGYPCKENKIPSPTTSCLHPDEDNILIPPPIVNGHYLHYHHVCAVLQCEHTPFDQVKRILSHAENYINPFPVLVKGTWAEISSIINSNDLLNKRTYKEVPFRIAQLYDLWKSGKQTIFEKNDAGYPMNVVIHAITFLVAAINGKLKGKRPLGSQEIILTDYLKENPDSTTDILIPDLMTPLIIKKDNHATMVGPINPSVYKRLIEFDTENEYKMMVRNIQESDLS